MSNATMVIEEPVVAPRAPQTVWKDHPNDVPVHPVTTLESRPVRTKSCPVCGETSARPRYRIGGTRFAIVDCQSCGLGSLYPAPEPDEIASFYAPDYYGAPGSKFVPVVERVVRLVGARRARSLSRGLSPGSRVLDVGCGRGVLLSALADRGLDTHGFEISEHAAKGADPRVRIRIANELAAANYPGNAFDLVVLWHVFEHLPNPGETLDEVRRILRPGGRVVVAVPNYSSLQSRWTGANWFHLDPPRHLYHFPASGLRRMLGDRGFELEAERHFSLRQNPFGWVQSLLNAVPGSSRNGLYAQLHTGSDSLQFSAANRFLSRAAYWLGMPIGVVTSLACAGLGSGASVSMVGRLPRT